MTNKTNKDLPGKTGEAIVKKPYQLEGVASTE